MSLVKTVRDKVSKFKEQYAIYGGHAANLYRHEPRAVTEISFALALGSAKKSRKIAEGILAELGYSVDHEWLDGLHSKTGKTVAVVLGTPPAGEDLQPLHFYVPSLPWVSKGVRRGQGTPHLIDGVEIPAIAVDDLIVAKFHSLTLNPKSKVDLDDLESIFKSETPIEIPYVMGELNMLELTIPKALEGAIPEELQKYIK
ncbi:MAG: hypothetical protein KDD70_14495 [Bdellovibrionales bacterium]|nr:hypothetical protein [Bdellovibrionales bacterium]